MDYQQAFNRDFAKILETLEQLNKNVSFNEEMSELQDKEILKLQDAIRQLCDSNVKLLQVLERDLLLLIEKYDKKFNALNEKCNLNYKAIQFISKIFADKLSIELGEIT